VRAARVISRGVHRDALEEVSVLVVDDLDGVDVLEEDCRRGLQGFSGGEGGCVVDVVLEADEAVGELVEAVAN